MTDFHVSTGLIDRAEAFGVRFHAARMGALAALPGNPFGVELRGFGAGVGVKVRHPLLRGKNRILGFTAEDLATLEELLSSYRDEALPIQLFVPHGRSSYPLFRRLTEAGLWTAGSGTVPVLIPEGDAAPFPPPEITVRRSEPNEKEAYLDLFQQAFEHRAERDPEYRAFQWAEDSLPGGARYVAQIDGVPVGMASFPIIDGVGFLGTAGVLPEYRGRGVQRELIRRRIADAPTLGCDLILAGGSPETTTYRNFERAGFRLIPTGSSWAQAPR